jgi:hypothetical protein
MEEMGEASAEGTSKGRKKSVVLETQLPWNSSKSGAECKELSKGSHDTQPDSEAGKKPFVGRARKRPGEEGFTGPEEVKNVEV